MVERSIIELQCRAVLRATRLYIERIMAGNDFLQTMIGLTTTIVFVYKALLCVLEKAFLSSASLY